jgi:hypothetical protein
MQKIYIFASLKSLKKGVRSGSIRERCGSGSGSAKLVPQYFLLYIDLHIVILGPWHFYSGTGQAHGGALPAEHGGA